MNVVGTNPGISSIITFNINGCTGKRQRFPRRHTGGQQVHEKMLNVANYQRNANQNHNEVITSRQSEMLLSQRLHIITEKAMATHSSTLAWKIPWMEGPGRLQSMGLLGVRYDWATSLSLFTFMHWRRKWQPLENPRDGEPGGLPSMGSHRVGCDWSDLAAAAASVHSTSMNTAGTPYIFLNK